MRVVALLTVRNEELYLGRCLAHLSEQGIETCVIDNESTDRTRAIAESFRHRGVFRIEALPYSGYFDLAAQVGQQEALAQEIDADWFIHHDADEIMQAPAAWPTMHAAITEIDAQGFNAINFDEFVFVPGEGDQFEGDDYVALMRHYYFFEPVPTRLVRAWKKGVLPVQLSRTGGHGALGKDRRLFHQNFILRHYIGLSLAHLKAQYLGRVFTASELARGWHRNRVATTQDFVRLPAIDQLNNVDRDGWRTDRKNLRHLVFNQPEPYIPPKPIAADMSRPPMPFVVGVPHSGANLLRLLLDAHPDLAMTPETGWLGAALEALQPGAPDDRFRRALSDAPDWHDMDMDDQALDAILAQPASSPSDRLRAIYTAYAARFGATRAGDATPRHGGRMIKILELLPEARFIHIIRDGRDVAVSHRTVGFGPGSDPEAAATFWMWNIREMRQQAQFIPYYMEIRYEDLVIHSERVLKEICKFIGLELHAEQRLELSQLASSPPTSARIEVWRHEMNPKDQAKFEKIAGGMLMQLGYI
jgi:hypothetical protein